MTEKKVVTKAKRAARSHKYVAARSLVDKTKSYPLSEAIELVKKTSYSKFVGSITADLVVKEIGEQGSLTLPHQTGKTIRVAIADEAVIEKIARGELDFEVLLSTPALVPKLAKYAKVLGPRGLMPNPKNGTITQQPEARKKELEGGKLTLKTEKKAPLIHLVVGTTAMETAQIEANLRALIESLDFRLQKLTLSASMGPGVRVTLN